MLVYKISVSFASSMKINEAAKEFSKKECQFEGKILLESKPKSGEFIGYSEGRLNNDLQLIKGILIGNSLAFYRMPIKSSSHTVIYTFPEIGQKGYWGRRVLDNVRNEGLAKLHIEKMENNVPELELQIRKRYSEKRPESAQNDGSFLDQLDANLILADCIKHFS